MQVKRPGKATRAGPSIKSDREFDAVIAAPFSHLGLKLMHGRLVEIEFLSEDVPLQENTHKVVQLFQKQLAEYCKDPMFRFEVPVRVQGTPYQKRVWQGIQDIPAGKTISYGQLAEQVSSGARAVGNACRRNPLPLLTPCHRIVAVNGMGGFAGTQTGYLMRVKQWLLKHEQIE